MPLILGLASCLALGQRVPYCNITSVRAKPLENGVQVIIQADGILDVRFNFEDYFNLEPLRMGNWEEFPKFVTALPFRVTNARSQIGSVVDVGVYPVSHVEASIPPESVDGVGLDLKTVLFEPAYTIGIQVQDEDPNFWNAIPDRPSVRIQMPPDQRSIIIIVSTDRRVDMGTVRTAPADGAQVVSKVERDGDRLNIEAANAPIAGVISQISAESGRPVFVENGLERWVTANLPEVTATEALEALSTMYGLELVAEGPSFRVSDGNLKSIAGYRDGNWKPVPLKHISALAARSSLPDFLLRFVSVDSEHNALLVGGADGLVEKVRQDLAKIDSPSPTIEFEATVVEFGDVEEADTALRILGGTGRINTEANLATGDITFDVLPNNPTTVAARLNTIVSSGKATIRAKTTVRAVNGQTGTLFAGAQRLAKFEFMDRFSNEIVSQIIPVDLGASLKAKGWAMGGKILVEVNPAVTSISSLEPGTGLPTVASRSAKANLILTSGDTMVVGGLQSDLKARSTYGIPVLSDLPLIGQWFRFAKKTSDSTALQMFITARIVDPSKSSQTSP